MKKLVIERLKKLNEEFNKPCCCTIFYQSKTQKHYGFNNLWIRTYHTLLNPKY